MFKSFLKIFSSSLFVQLGTFALLPIYLSVMSKSEYGLYAYYVSIATALASLLGLGQANCVLHIRKKGFVSSHLIKKVLQISLISFIVFIAFFLFSTNQDYIKNNVITLLFKDFPGEIAILLIVLVAITVSSRQLLNSFFSAIGLYTCFSFYTIVLFITSSAFCLSLLVFVNSASIQRLLGLAAAEFLCLIIFTFFAVKHGRQELEGIDSQEVEVKSFSWHFSYALPFCVTAFCNATLLSVDKFYLQEYHSLENVAVYAVAFRIMTPILLIGSNIQTILFKQFYENSSNSKNFLLLLKLFGIIIIIAFSIVLLFKLAEILCLHFEIEFLQSDYFEINSFLYILALAISFQYAFSLLLNYFRKFELTTYVLIAGPMLLLFNILFNSKLTPLFAEVGASMSYLLTYFVGFVFLGIILIFKRKALNQFNA